MSKGWSRFMHETLHHKLNSAIMAWYWGPDFFFFLVVWLLGLGSGPLGVYRIVHGITATCRLFACAMWAMRGNYRPKMVPHLLPQHQWMTGTEEEPSTGMPTYLGRSR